MGNIGWLFTAMAIIGTVINARGNRSCFYVWIISNTGFVIINLLSGSYSQAVLFAFNLTMCGVGLKCWKPQIERR